MKEISRRANKLGIKTKLQADKSKRQSTGLWYPRTIGRMLTNEVYTGKIYIRKYLDSHIDLKTLDDKKYMRDKEDWILIEVPQYRTLFYSGLS